MPRFCSSSIAVFIVASSICMIDARRSSSVGSSTPGKNASIGEVTHLKDFHSDPSRWETFWVIPPEQHIISSLKQKPKGPTSQSATSHQNDQHPPAEQTSESRPFITTASSDKINVIHSSYDVEEDYHGPAGSLKAPPCAYRGRYYCTYKEDYPSKIVNEVTKYYKYPLEKLFKDIRLQTLPPLAENGYGALVCDAVTKVFRPGWSKNTNGYWLVVINTEYYQQYVTEVSCKYKKSLCNFVPPCYHATCQQRYNTQKLLVIDPWNPYKGPFLSEFLFPSCCVCFVPGGKDYEVKATYH